MSKLISYALLFLVQLVVITSMMLPAQVAALIPADGGAPGANSSDSTDSTTCKTSDALCADCAGKKTDGCINCTGGSCSDPAADPTASCSKNNCDFVKKYVNPTINLLSVCFGLIAVISIILGGIQYAASEGDPQNVAKAKSRVKNTILAIVAYFMLYSFLQFLIPGGIF